MEAEVDAGAQPDASATGTPRPRRPWSWWATRGGLVALALVLVGLGASAGWRAWQDAGRSDLERALRLAPESAERFAWTDWVGVRREAGAPETGRDPLDHLLERGFELDLTSTTAMGESAQLLAAEFGFSPLEVDWELLAQSEQGSVLLLGMPEDFDVASLEATWDSLGYERPAEEDGVWEGGDTLLAQIAAGRSVSPQFAHLAVDADRGIVMASEGRDFLGVAVRALDADGSGDGGGDGLGPVLDSAAAVGPAVSAVLLGGDVACRTLAMSQADQLDQAVAEDLVERAGPVDPLTSLAIAAGRDGRLRVAMSFETDEQARENADSRARLAAGPAPGQGGEFADRFAVEEAGAQGRVVTLVLDPVEGAYVLSDLSSGPVLFATC